MIKYLSKTKPSLLKGTALLRLDFNTEDEWRMEAALSTIRFLEKTADRVVILSHRGRPINGKIVKGVPRGFDSKLCLKNDGLRLQKYLKKPIHFIPHFRFEEIKETIAAAPRQSIFLLENLRFLPGEAYDDLIFAKELASLGDYYINDAFAVSHRANASVVAITKLLPSYAGLELEKELHSLSTVLTKPKHPLLIILGGGKAHDKLGVIRHFKKKADAFLIGGVGANTFYFLKGIEVGKSVYDSDPKDLAELKKVIKYANIYLPIDYTMEKGMIVDIGKGSVKEFTSKIRAARTIIWTGPFGRIESKKYAWGSIAIAKAIARNKKAFSVAGGGETVMFLKEYHLDKQFSFISTGGGAMIDFLAGEKLPGIEALKNSL